MCVWDLKATQKALDNYPKKLVNKSSVNEIDYRPDSGLVTYIGRFVDGTAIFWRTEATVEERSHSLIIVPTDGNSFSYSTKFR